MKKNVGKKLQLLSKKVRITLAVVSAVVVLVGAPMFRPVQNSVFADPYEQRISELNASVKLANIPQREVYKKPRQFPLASR